MTACLGHDTTLQMAFVHKCSSINSFSRLNVTLNKISYLQLTEKVATHVSVHECFQMCILLLPERQLPVPLDKGNEGSEDEITKAVGGQTHRARIQNTE